MHDHSQALLSVTADPCHSESRWSYEQAFSRHRGLVSRSDQETLQSSRVAIAGMGGVGGIHLITLARLGIGGFTIADPDHFELPNFNRQAGATTQTIGKMKTDVLAAEAKAINPDVRLRVYPTAIQSTNVSEFLDEADVLVDGIDFFNIAARRLLFSEARRRNIWAVTAGPIGFSTAWLLFAPNGLSFDAYFDINDDMTEMEQLVAFAVGLTPRATHLRYLDLTHVSKQGRTGPSAALACHLASGVVAAEVIKILLGGGLLRPVPCFAQFDAYRNLLRRGRMIGGNRNPVQRLKRWWLTRKFAHME